MLCMPQLDSVITGQVTVHAELQKGAFAKVRWMRDSLPTLYAVVNLNMKGEGYILKYEQVHSHLQQFVIYIKAMKRAAVDTAGLFWYSCQQDMSIVIFDNGSGISVSCLVISCSSGPCGILIVH